MNLNQTTVSSKEKKLCTITDIQFATFLGGPLCGFYFISKNFDTLGNKTEAKKNLFYGLLFTAILFSSLILIPDKILNHVPHVIVPILFASIIGVYAKILQKNEIEKGLLSGVKKYPTLKVILISLLLFAISLIVCMIFYFFITLIFNIANIGKANLFGDIEYNIGLLYQQGKIVSQNDGETAKWFYRAAEHNNSDAQNDLGVLYHEGKGVPQSDAEANKWFFKSAEQDNPVAQNNLGNIFYTGKGVKQNYSESFMWYSKAAAQGYSHAELNLGLAYQNGEGVLKNDVEAAKLISKAAMQGYSVAEFSLAAAYHFGKGVTQNETKAMHWLKKSAKQNFPPAQQLLHELNHKTLESNSLNVSQIVDNDKLKLPVQKNTS